MTAALDVHLLCCRSVRTRALALAVLGIIAASPEALLLRLALEQVGTNLWELIACQSGASACFSFLAFIVTSRGKGIVAGVRATPRLFVLAIVLNCGVIFGRTAALVESNAATALILMSLCPMWAACMAWHFLGDNLPMRTIVVLVICCCAAALSSLPPLIENWDEAHFTGGLAAFATGVALAAFLTTCRGTMSRRADAPIGLAVSLSAATVCLVMLPFGDPWVGWGDGGFWLIAIGAGLCHSVCTNLCWVRASRFLTPGEVGLVLLMEDIFAPLWVYLGVGEAPSGWTIAGGTVLVISIASHEMRELLGVRRTSRSSSRTRLRGPSLGGVATPSARPMPLKVLAVEECAGDADGAAAKEQVTAVASSTPVPAASPPVRLAPAVADAPEEVVLSPEASWAQHVI